MPRWDPEAEERLRTAAIELFIEQGFENVTVTQIADRAGLTRRTFSRYFTDKRDVLFAGSDQLPGVLAEALVRAEASLSPYDALVEALAEVGAALGARVGPLAGERRAVIDASPELQERGRTKFAEVADALAGALSDRGVDRPSAVLLADVGVAVFRSAFAQWVDDPSAGDLDERMRQTARSLSGAVGAEVSSTRSR